VQDAAFGGRVNWCYDIPMTEIRLLQITDKDQLLQFSRALLAMEVLDPAEREMQSWSAGWRAEALDHYLPQGWSFGAYDEQGSLIGFVLCQPLLFHRTHAQTLWVEHLAALDDGIALELTTTVQRWAKDKHFQCVLGEGLGSLQKLLTQHQPTRVHGGHFVELRTTKF